MWQTVIGKWIRKYWLWVFAVLALIILGVISGWKLAALLGVGVGGIAGGAGIALDNAQKRREADAQQLEQELQSLEDRAHDTDQMVEKYYRRRGGSKE